MSLGLPISDKASGQNPLVSAGDRLTYEKLAGRPKDCAQPRCRKELKGIEATTVQLGGLVA